MALVIPARQHLKPSKLARTQFHERLEDGEEFTKPEGPGDLCFQEKQWANLQPRLSSRKCYPEYPFCFSGGDSISPVAAAAIYFCICPGPKNRAGWSLRSACRIPATLQAPPFPVHSSPLQRRLDRFPQKTFFPDKATGTSCRSLPAPPLSREFHRGGRALRKSAWDEA
jgi:hypothetical protein